MTLLTDAHTHHADRRGAIINIAPGAPTDPSLRYSAGIHPWLGGEATADTLRELAATVSRPEVIAIGETGLDALRGPGLKLQEALMKEHIALSERLGKPLIVHAVKSLDDILRLRRELRPRQPWIWHGFRGKPQMARQIADAGIYISAGEGFNRAAIEAIPLGHLLVETDESPLAVAEIARQGGIDINSATEALNRLFASAG